MRRAACEYGLSVCQNDGERMRTRRVPPSGARSSTTRPAFRPRRTADIRLSSWMPEVSRLTAAVAALSRVSTPSTSRAGVERLRGAESRSAGSRIAGRQHGLGGGGRLERWGPASGAPSRADVLHGHDDVVRVVAKSRLRRGERVRPALVRAPAGAGRVVGLLELEGVRQRRVTRPGRRRALVDRAAERHRIELDRGVGTEGLAHVLQRRPARARIGQRKETAVAGPHAHVHGAAEAPAAMPPVLRRAVAMRRAGLSSLRQTPSLGAGRPDEGIGKAERPDMDPYVGALAGTA